MNNLLKLIKLSWGLKLAMWRCRRFDQTTDEYRLAKHFQQALDTLDHKEQNCVALLLEAQELQNKFQDRAEIRKLLTSVILFLNHLKSTGSY